jgi:hypothetical protein
VKEGIMEAVKGQYSESGCNVVVFDPPEVYELELLRALAADGLASAVKLRSWQEGESGRVAHQVSVRPTDVLVVNKAWAEILIHYVRQALRSSGAILRELALAE